MDVMTLSEVTQGLALLQVQGDVEAGLKLVGVGVALPDQNSRYPP